VEAEKHLGRVDDAEGGIPYLGFAEVHSEHQQVGIVAPAGEPGFDRRAPFLVEPCGVGFLAESAGEAGEEVVSLAGESGGGGAAGCERPATAGEEPDRAVGARIGLRGHRNGWAGFAVELEEDERAVGEGSPEFLFGFAGVGHGRRLSRGNVGCLPIVPLHEGEEWNIRGTQESIRHGPVLFSHWWRTAGSRPRAALATGSWRSTAQRDLCPWQRGQRCRRRAGTGTGA